MLVVCGCVVVDCDVVFDVVCSCVLWLCVYVCFSLFLLRMCYCVCLFVVGCLGEFVFVLLCCVVFVVLCLVGVVWFWFDVVLFC